VPLGEGTLSAIVLEGGGGVAGFGLLKPFLPFPMFRKTCTLTYFIAPETAGKGLGSRLLERLSGMRRRRG